MKKRVVLLRVFLVWSVLTGLLSPNKQASGKAEPIGLSLGAGETAAAVSEGSIQPDLAGVEAWLGSGWGYRRPVTISNACGQEQTNFQARLELTSAFDFSHARSDGGDVRFTTSDGQTQIPFWIESWTPPTSAVIWVKAPSIPVNGTALYMYYGNANPPAVPQVDVAPTGPWSKPSGNPITPIGDPGSGDDLLADSFVYDEATGHYWMAFANYRDGSVGLVWSDDPANPAAWNWTGSIMTSANAPFLIQYNGTWYLFYADRGHGGPPYPIALATASSVNGTYTYQGIALNPGSSGSWEDYRVDEPFVFWHAGQNKWFMVYMGDAGGNAVQVGYATANDIIGPYTKYASNPVIGFGVSGTYDGGSVSNPWVYEYQGTYTIGYAASLTTSSPLQTAYATTSDWVTFTKQGMTLPVGTPGAFDAANAFRGMVTRIGDVYYFPYTASATSGVYRMVIATQPAKLALNSAELVFEFHDFFDGNALSTKWNYYLNGSGHTIAVSGGSLNVTTSAGTSSGLVQLWGSRLIGSGSLLEVYARHQDAGVNAGSETNTALEVGYKRSLTSFVDNHLRLMDYPDLVKFVMESAAAGSSSGFVNLAVDFDTGWHTYTLSRTLTGGQAGFQIDSNAPEYLGSPYVPTLNMQPWLASYARTPATQSRISVDWIRVRKWCGVEMSAVFGTEQLAVDLSLTKTDAPDPVYFASPLTYNLTVSNLGYDTATGVVITDTLPAGVTFVSALPSQGICSGSGPVYCALGNVASSAQASVAIVVTPNILGPIINNAQTATSYPERALNNNSASATTTVVPGVDLAINISDSPDPVYFGDPLTYNLTIANFGPRPASGVLVTDTLPAGVTFVSVLPSQGNCSGSGPVVCSLGNISNGGVATIAIVVTPHQLGLLTNTARTTTPLPEISQSNNTDSENTTVNPGADLSLSKSDAPDPAYLTEPLTYTLTVANIGPRSASGVVLTDTLPSGVALTSVDPSQGFCSGDGPVYCALGLISSGGQAVVNIVVVPNSLGLITNQAETATPIPEINLLNNNASANTMVLPAADLEMVKTASVDATQADTFITYTLAVTNLGPSLAEAVVLTDILPARLQLISVQPSQDCSLVSPVVCQLGDLTVGDSTTVTILARTLTEGVAINTAEVNASTHDPDANNNIDEHTLIISEALVDLSAFIAETAPVVAGELLTYTISVHNAGPSIASNVRLTDTIPAETSLIEVIPGLWDCSGLICTLDSLPMGNDEELKIVVRVDSGASGMLTDTAVVTSTEPDIHLGDNTAVEETWVIWQADLTVDITAFPEEAVAGMPLTYTLTVDNLGPSDVLGIVVTGTLPAGVTLQTADPGCVGIGESVVCDLGSLAASGQTQAGLVVLVDAAVTGVLTSRANVSAQTVDPNLVNNEDVLQTAINVVADLEITSAGAPQWARPGGVVTYTLTVVNHGPSDVVNVVVTDSLPADVSFVPSPPGQPACSVIPATNGVLCNLGAIAVGDDLQFVVAGTIASPITGELTNLAEAGSEATDPQLSDNHTEVTVPVDDQPPLGWWVAPVGDEQRFDIEGGVITLTAGASDNNGIAQVCFIWWDPVAARYRDIGCVQSAPYSLAFDTQVLYPGWNQVLIKVYDLAGNLYQRQSPQSKYPRILLYLITDFMYTYLPVILR